MTLRTLFATPIVVILLMTMSLAGMTVSREWYGQQRGRIAIAATERANLLNLLEGQLGNERVATWDALAADYPPATPVAHQLADARAETDRVIKELRRHAKSIASARASSAIWYSSTPGGMCPP